MSRYVLRTDDSQPVVADATMLDWFPGLHASTVQSSSDLLAELSPPPAAVDFLSLAVAAYCADRLELRQRWHGRWERDFTLAVPVIERDAMRLASESLTDAMRFVTSDEWTLRFTRRRAEPPVAAPASQVDAVCLFSAGLDSLAGAVDLLENGATVCLVSHYEGGLAPSRQRDLLGRLRSHYGGERVLGRKLFLRPAAPDEEQARPLRPSRENTMRGRSLLFIAAGVAVAAGYGPNVPLHIPENGLIGINVPLTGARPASLSTRTTHPFYMERLRFALQQIGLQTPVLNSFRLATKGEALADSRNWDLLKRLAPISLSCAHPEAGRLHNRRVGNCGYCFPCLIRRSALHHVGEDSGAAYAIDAVRDPSLLDLTDAGADLRALLLSLGRPAHQTDVLRNGPIAPNEVAAFADTHRRGRRELRAWLLDGGNRRVQRALARDVP